MRRKWKRALSLLCTLAMIAGMLPVSSLAAAGQAQTVDGGINGYAAAMQADEVTSGGWRTAFVADGVSGAQEIDGTNRSPALNGKIWTDKSVSIGDNNDFDVTFSALGQTFAASQTTTTEVGLDFVFVVDVSGSMNEYMRSGNEWTYKMEATKDALNQTFDRLMAGENNRAAVVTFSSEATTFVPLNHYTKPTYGDFFSYEGTGGNSQETGTLRFNAQGQYQRTASVIGGTSQQEGIFEAADVFSNATIPDDGITRIPVIIMLSDGEPSGMRGYTSTDYQNDGNSPTPSRNSVSEDIKKYYYTLLSCAYMKDQIQSTYAQKQPGKDVSAKFYTIGLGMNGNDAKIMLDPSIRNDGTAQYSELTDAINDNSTDQMEISTYDYANESWSGDLSSDDLNTIFKEIVDTVTSITGGASAGETVGGRDKITYFETLGEGVQFTGEMTLRVPSYQITKDSQGNDQIVKGETKIYDLQAYATNTVGNINAGDPINAENGPDYVENGGVVAFRGSNSEAQTALENLSITVRQLSSGERQMQVDIPQDLMAYNIINESKNTYYVSDSPIQLTYGVKMRADVEEAGSYLVSAPTRSYVHFIPSSAQTVEGTYDMPYYWPGGQFANDQAQVGKDKTDGAGVDGASDYVTAATKGNNNDVYIYLGNNGLYTLEGKQLTFHLFWDDADNQDGKRPDTVTVQLYQEAVNRDSTDIPASAPTTAVEYRSPISLTSSNAYQGDQKQWEYTTQDLPVYDTQGNYLRYWLKIVSSSNDYTDDLHATGTHNNGIKLSGTDGSVWYCFSVSGGLLTDAKLDVKLSHTPETIEYNITKEWDISTGDASTTVDSVQVQLYANAVPVNKNGTTEGNTDPFEITQGKNWTETLTLPRCSEGVEISYTLVEQGDQYTAIVDSQRDADTGDYTATITNYSNVDKTNFTAIKTWNDADNQDGIRPESVTFTLTAKTADESELEADDLGLSSLEATVTANNNWRYT